MATCYRHPDRETGVSCSNCGNPICPDCMTATSVGMRCPDCARQKTKVHTVRSMYAPPTVTYVLIGICVLAAFGGGGLVGGRTQAWVDGALIGYGFSGGDLIGVAAGEYWRLVSSGFLHGGLFHLMFNMFALYSLGVEMEPVLGRARYLTLYFTSMLAGSFGALLLNPSTLTVGASGAIFGLFGAAFVMQHQRGINPMQSGIGITILLNLGLTFLVPNISIGGHIGGLIGGALTALIMERVNVRGRPVLGDVLASVPIAIVSVVGAVVFIDARASALGLIA
jgi:membrane associated rhomboid family serine protease